MVKGLHFCLATVFYVTIVKLPQINGHFIPIQYVYNNNGLGTYSFEYSTLDGSYRKEDGGMLSDLAGVVGLVVRGEYGYVDPDGRSRHVKYIADTNGFRQTAYSDTAIRYNDRRIV